MNEDFEELKTAAREARSNAYAPDSGYAVGAAALGDSGDIATGVNIEYGGRGGIHAEQLAVYKLVEKGEIPILAVAVSTETAGGRQPCGICLHTISNFGGKVTLLSDAGDMWRSSNTVAELPNAASSGRTNTYDIETDDD